MAQGIFEALHGNQAVVFAAAIPATVVRPPSFEATEYLRKDHVFLFERFFSLLETKQEHGLLILDEVDKTEDRRFVRRLESYFTKTSTGRYRTTWIVPAPLFVSSEMTYAVQAADLVIYCINWGFRIPASGMNAPTRTEISSRFASWIGNLQFRGHSYRDGNVFDIFGVTFVPDPYTARESGSPR